MNFIFILIVLAVVFIIWLRRNMRIVKTSNLSEQKKHKESLEAEEKKGLRTEENILEQREERKRYAEVEEAESKAKVERGIREMELRRKIKDRKDREAEEEKRKMEENKENG